MWPLTTISSSVSFDLTPVPSEGHAQVMGFPLRVQFVLRARYMRRVFFFWGGGGGGGGEEGDIPLHCLQNLALLGTDYVLRQSTSVYVFTDFCCSVQSSHTSHWL